MTAAHHIGSTAISGLIARPTVDVVTEVLDEDAAEHAALLIEGLNFRRVLPPMWAADALMLEKPRHIPDGEVATHRILVVMPESPTLRRTLAVRNYLRENAAEAIRFEETKVKRWRDHDGDPQRYAADKAVFFAHLEEQLGV